MKYSCDEIKSKLSEYIDDILSGEDKKSVEKHISCCKACASEYDTLKSLINELNMLPSEPLPADFKGKLHKRLMEHKMFIKQNYFMRDWKRHTALVAGLILVLLIPKGYFKNYEKIKTAYVDDAVLQADNSGTLAQQMDPSSSPATSTAPTDNGYKSAQSKNEKQSDNSNEISESNTQMNSYAVADIIDQPKADNNTPAPTVKPQEIPKETPMANAKQPEYNDAVYSMKNQSANIDTNSTTGSSEDKKASSGSGGGSSGILASPPTVSQKSIRSSHENEAPSFVSVMVSIDNFDKASAILKEKYNVQVQDGSIILELGNEEFKGLMNLLTTYGAVVIQEEMSQPLTINKCVITSK